MGERRGFTRSKSQNRRHIPAGKRFQPPDKGASFGGSLIVSPDGKIIAETTIGRLSTLIYELSVRKSQ